MRTTGNAILALATLALMTVLPPALVYASAPQYTITDLGSVPSTGNGGKDGNELDQVVYTSGGVACIYDRGTIRPAPPPHSRASYTAPQTGFGVSGGSA
jgi:hypothetical protein